MSNSQTVPLEFLPSNVTRRLQLQNRLRFAPEDGRIWLGDERMVLFHSASLGALRQELIEGLGIEGARNLLMRIGYKSGSCDAALVRRNWPGEGQATSLLYGTLVHALEGIVRVETLHMESDTSRGHFRGEYLWYDSCEASEHVATYGIGNECVCWMQLGYASGFASAFIGKLVSFHETECAARGAKACRIIGTTADPKEGVAGVVGYTVNHHGSLMDGPAQLEQAAPAQAKFRSMPAHQMVGVSPAFNAACYKIERVAPTKAPVVFLGETGVGKELFAQNLHRIGSRSSKPFVAVNCAAIPETLIESELFGVERGAFTGAVASRPGRFERAANGTLFLDELSSLSLAAQAKLLRALQEGEIERIGGTRTIKVDVRVIAATNRDLRAEVKAGRFREDLYYRLNVFPIYLPPLRERRDDIPLLMEYFLSVYSGLYGKSVAAFSPRAVGALLEYDYPGNIRELQNLIERGVISADDGAVIDAGDMFQSNELMASRPSLELDSGGRLAEPADTVVRSFVDQDRRAELDRYREAVRRCRGNLSAAARELGLTRAQLAYRLCAAEWWASSGT